MKRILLLLLLALWIAPTQHTNAATRNPKAIMQMLDRIGGRGTSKRFEIQLDESFTNDSQEQFCLYNYHGKPLVKGSSVTAIGAGINWYLNHYAHVNLSWNQLTTDLSNITLPLPTHEETHACKADYRYYLNYCTFGYSMSTWTWERWEQEIDWMALHGINMPLQIVGLEAVWRDFLLQDCHYSLEQVEQFIPGPAFTAWWGMNNLEGWGRLKTDDKKAILSQLWWKRQADLARKICEREREMGMQPVLPGFSGMVPSNFQDVTKIGTEKANLWCQFQRPAILDPTSADFSKMAKQYYLRLRNIMGDSKYYSMDPFHEGGTISSGKYEEGYKAIYEAMNACCGVQSKWVIQQWQWTSYQASSLQAIPAGRLIVLDLYSDAIPGFEHFGGYLPQESIYCTIPNFGGRTGYMGRLPKLASHYFECLKQYSSLRGIGAAPEAIESVPIVYDLLFELPWMSEQPHIEEWVKNYTINRYGIRNEKAKEAWMDILHTALNERTTLQGPHEAVMCARPSLEVNTVSTWGGTDIFYPSATFEKGVRTLLEAAETIGTTGRKGTAHHIGAANMSYDLCDMVRQVMSDRSKMLLQEIKKSGEDGRTEKNEELKQKFLTLILQTDRLLGTQSLFRLGHWTESARLMANEIICMASKKERAMLPKDAEDILADWLEYDNARTLITTWGDHAHSEWGGLHDYSYRQWQGMLSDFYLPRWQYFFNHTPGHYSTPQEGWFFSEWNWAHEMEGTWGSTTKGNKRKAQPKRYSAQPEGDTFSIAKEIFTQQ